MRFRTRLYLFFLANSLIAIIISLGILQFKTRNALFNELESKAIAIAATTAIAIDGEMVKKIQTVEDQTSPDYLTVQKQLRLARDANRSNNIYVKYLYITRPDPQNPKVFRFVVDPEENIKDFSPVGQEDPGTAEALLYNHLYEGYSFGKLVTDPWGTWLTGYAPILDSNKNYVGTIGVDIGAKLVQSSINRVFYYVAIAFVVSFIFALFAATFLAQYSSKAIETLAKATLEIGKGDLEYRIPINSKDEFGDLARSMNQMCEGLEEKERLKIGFAHYVSQHVLEQILQSKTGTKLEGETRKVTVFFSDIRGFTHIAEHMKPEDVVRLLNEYFKAMLSIIFKYNGMLDKLMGDGIMAEFGAPLDDPQQERHAILTALEMQKELVHLRETWKKEGKPAFEIGVGIHTGDAIVGNIGSELRMEYTAIGDTVNVASRLEQITRKSQYSIIISETTYHAVKNEFEFHDLGLVELIGREKPIRAYGLIPETYKGTFSA